MIFFDLDGTLLDSNGIWLEIDIAFLQQYGISPVPADYTEYVTHHSAPDAAQYTQKRYSLPCSAGEIQAAWLEMARQAYAHHLNLKPGVYNVLHQCQQKHVPMAVLTSCIPELCQAALQRHGILPWFQEIVYTQTYELEKGNPMLYRLAAARWKCAPAMCTLFEDSPGYCAAAKEAGFFVVGVQDSLYRERELELRTLCDSWVTDFRKLPDTVCNRLFSESIPIK